MADYKQELLKEVAAANAAVAAATNKHAEHLKEVKELREEVKKVSAQGTAIVNHMKKLFEFLSEE